MVSTPDSIKPMRTRIIDADADSRVRQIIDSILDDMACRECSRVLPFNRCVCGSKESECLKEIVRARVDEWRGD
jgi:hypothetical protein